MQETKTQIALSRRLVALLVSLVLVVGLAPIVPTGQAWAADEASAVTVALTIVDTTDNDKVLTNEKIATLTSENTVADLLKAAGYTVGTQAESAKDSKIYFESYNAPYFLGKGWVDPNYWVSYSDATADLYSGASLTSKLVDGKHYIYTYGTAAFTYNETVTDPLDSSSDPSEPSATSYAGAYTSEKAASLIANLNKRFILGGTNAAFDNSTFAAAFALSAQDMSDSIDTAAVLKALDADTAMTAGRLGKYITILSSAGVDCTAVSDNGTTRDLVAEMVDLITDPTQVSLYDAVFILPAIDLEDDGTVDDTLIEAIVEDITDTQDADTGLFVGSWGADAQTTAQAVLALVTHDATGNAEAIKDAVEGLKSYQSTDGGFIYNKTYGTSGDVDTTGTVVAALVAAGTDPSTVKTADGTTPLDYLLANADESLDGYVTYAEASFLNDDIMTSSVALMGLVAYQGYLKAGSAFNVYTDVIAAHKKHAEEKDSTSTDSTSTNTSSTTSATTAATGDATAPYATGAFVFAVGAAGALALMRRKRD